MRPSFIAITYVTDEVEKHAIINIEDISSVQQIDGNTAISMRPGVIGICEYYPVGSVLSVIEAMVQACATVIPVGRLSYPGFMEAVGESSQ